MTIRPPWRLPWRIVLGALLAQCTSSPSGLGMPCVTTADCGSALLACTHGACAVAPPSGGRCPPGAGDPPGAGGPVRVFAVGQTPTLADAVSYDTFARMVRRAVDRDVVPHLATDRPNLLVFPEDSGFIADFIGPRAATARTRTDSTGAFLALATAYDSAARFYTARAPQSLPPARPLDLALTDTLRRSLDAAYAPLARELHAWVAVTYNLADADRSTDPALVRLLADPDAADRSFAWVARGDQVYDQTLIFGPDGTLVASLKKEYLAPGEETALTLSYGPPGNLRGVDLPFGRVASAIGKDAWMPDVLDRLSLDGVELVLQPEASSGWGAFDPDGAWLPDVMREGGWSHVSHFPGFHANVLACLSANVFDQVFDCQSAVLVPGGEGSPRGSFIGEDPDVGFASVASWSLTEDPSQPLDARRMALAARGRELQPGGSRAGQYTEGVAWYDLDLGAGRSPATGISAPDVPVSAEVAPTTDGEQSRPDLVALATGELVAAWEDTREGCSRIYLARSLARQVAFTQARPRVTTLGAPRAPRLAARGSADVVMVWQEAAVVTAAVTGTPPRDDDVYFARSNNGGQDFLPSVRLGGAGAVGTQQWRPSVAIDPVDGTVHVAWFDTRNGPARLYVTRSADGGAHWDPEHPVEPVPTTAYSTRQNGWAPSIAAQGGRVVVAWADFRASSWEIWGAESADAGHTWGAPLRVDDAGTRLERIDSEPAAWIDPAGGWGAAWTDLRVRAPDYDTRFARVDGGTPRASTVLPRSDTAHRPQGSAALASGGNGRLTAVWQDLRPDANHVYSAASTDGGRTWGADHRVDDGPGAAQQYTPRVAVLPGGQSVAVWDDDRSGHHRVRVATLP